MTVLVSGFSGLTCSSTVTGSTLGSGLKAWLNDDGGSCSILTSVSLTTATDVALDSSFSGLSCRSGFAGLTGGFGLTASVDGVKD